MIQKLVIIGVGLIGGSFARALRQAGQVGEIVGVGRSAENLKMAVDVGVIDKATDDLAQAVQGADLILLAVPVGGMGPLLATMAPHLGANTVVTDAGSTKQDVVALARQHLGTRFSQFVPGHPIAGAESSGVAAAQADLFQGRKVVLTPLSETHPDAKASVAAAWSVCGAQVVEMEAATHDAVFAAVSHLPHILAYALVDYIATQGNAEELFGFTAGGFRDFTRIAGSSPEMWRDICMANRDALLAEITGYELELSAIKNLIAAGDHEGLTVLFSRARAARQRHLKTP